MAKVLHQADAKRLGLAGRLSLEIVSGEKGARNASLRLVEIPVPQRGEPPRNPHVHHTFEECIYVLAGEGTTQTATGPHPLKAGDTILISAGEPHVTRNTGSTPLLLLCFFPTADVAAGTEDLSGFTDK
jgi:quercetin dioxygenase-like cupin family protein